MPSSREVRLLLDRAEILFYLFNLHVEVDWVSLLRESPLTPENRIDVEITSS